MDFGLEKKFTSTDLNHLLWEVEISDLGACKPFLGFSLTNQYILIGITSPDSQNEVTISTLPESLAESVIIPLNFGKFEFPKSGKLVFKGIQRLKDKWNIKLVNSQTMRAFSISSKSSISLQSIQEKAAFGSNWKSGLSLQLVLSRK